MRIPELKFRETQHGRGSRGMYFYEYADTAGMGVRVQMGREAGARSETQIWWMDALPGQTFSSFQALQSAAESLTEEQAAAERAKWPQVEMKPEFEGSHNRCRLCPREPHTQATHRVTIHGAWKHIGHYAGLCDEHAKLAETPAALVAALDEEVAARKARAAAKMALLANAPAEEHR